MRVCPKCGYIDSPNWRRCIQWNTDYMPLSDFITENSELAQLVQHQKYVEDPPFVYHMTKAKNFYRMALLNNPTYSKNWHLETERVYHKCRHDQASHVARSIARKNVLKRTQTKLLELKE